MRARPTKSFNDVHKADASRLRVGVFCGGKSIECEVSFNSGRTICDHLDTSVYEIIPIFQTKKGLLYILPWHFLHRGKISDFEHRLAGEAELLQWDDLKDRVDFIYIAVHGRFAEDGTMQGMLEILDIPYLGAKVFGSALSMDKVMQRQLLTQHGIPVAKGIVVRPRQINTDATQLPEICKQLEEKQVIFPVIVKPAYEGSSLGISVVFSVQELMPALIKAMHSDSTYNQPVIIEEKVEGIEFNCIALKQFPHATTLFNLDEEKVDRVGDWYMLPHTEVELEAGKHFYDYEQKYMPGRAKKITPARYSVEARKKISQLCAKVNDLLEFKTISRIDGFLRPNGEVVIIDPNSLSGMAPNSFFFHQAAEAGMNHTQLINYLITAEMHNHDIAPAINVPTKQEGKDMKKIRVAVLLGGDSTEREISLESGRNVCYKLSPQKYEVLPIFIDENMQLYHLSAKLLIQNSTNEIITQVADEMKMRWADLPSRCDFVFIALHGGKGEDGTIQGALEMLGLPYNGSSVLASALSMNKYKTNEFLKRHGFDVPYSTVVNKEAWHGCVDDAAKETLITTLLSDTPFPFIMKPVDEGCSSFVSKIKNMQQFLSEASRYFDSDRDHLMIEEYIDAIELTGGVIGNTEAQALPPSQPAMTKDILSIEEKFLPGAGENITPANLPHETLTFVMRTLEKVYMIMGLKGYARIDCFYQAADKSPSKKERVIMLEVNNLPGLTPATCIFHQAAEIGLKPMEFIDTLVTLGFEQHRGVVKNSDIVVEELETLVRQEQAS